MDAREVATPLTRWFSQNARDLPWRRTYDPYHVLVAEFILQQTRMETGVRYFERFVERFPDVRALARARVASVVALWSGLGYYSRARNLHATARTIMARHSGRVPKDPDVLETLPGIGPYTAGAIASIAYDRPVPSLDGNQLRVLGRILRTTQKSRIESFAKALLAQASPRLVNQAMMELGALVCAPVPRCDACPVARSCRSRGKVRAPRHATSSPTEEHWKVRVHRRHDALWLVPPRAEGLLAGLWLPPMEKDSARSKGDRLTHRFSHRTWSLRLVLDVGRPSAPGRWIRHEDLDALPHARLTRRIMEAALDKSVMSPSRGGRRRAPTRPASSRPSDAPSP